MLCHQKDALLSCLLAVLMSILMKEVEADHNHQHMSDYLDEFNHRHFKVHNETSHNRTNHSHPTMFMVRIIQFYFVIINRTRLNMHKRNPEFL